MEATLDATVDNIASQLGMDFTVLDRLFDRELAPEDVTEEYERTGVGTLKLKFFDSDYLIKGVAYFRPYIRGFIVLLLVLFSWQQIMSFIGQDPGIAHHAKENYEKWKNGDSE